MPKSSNNSDRIGRSNTPSAADSIELRRAEERFRLVVESAPAAMVIVDQAGRIVLVNQQTENWFGYSREEMIGQTVEFLIPARFHDQHRADRDGFLASPHARPMGAGHDLFGRRRDDSEFPVDISLHPMETADGTLVMAHIVDLTDRKYAEQEVQRSHSLERLALLGKLAAGVAHEIRNPLGVIQNAAYYLKLIPEPLDLEVRESVAEILREVDRANRIVSDLLGYVRHPQQAPGVFDLAERVRTVSTSQEQLLGVTIKVELPNDSLWVAADPDHVDRILVNLIRNGAQACDHSGSMTISLQSDGKSTIIDVADDGPGITEADRQRVFEPLFTTKSTGIGLGLAVSQWYAERNGGCLELVKSAGQGTTFRLTLPTAGSR